jgi:hypothetical protein
VDGAVVSLSRDGSLALPPGRHLLRIEAAGHRPLEQSIDIAAGKIEVTRARLVRLKPAAVPEPRAAEPTPKPVEVPASGTIVVTGSLPPGAEIALDGETLAEGLREIPTESGSHWLRLSAPGYQPDSSQVEVTGREQTSWEAPALTAILRVITVEIAMSDTTIPIGRIVPLRARARDDAGAELTDSLIWESGDAAIARVDRQGRVTGVAAGRTYIRAGTHDRADSTLVTVVAPPPKPKPVAAAPPPAPAPVARPAIESKPAVPATPSAANIQAAVTACAGALGSGDERRIVQAYQPKTAQDVANLRKILELAIRPGAALEATATAVSAPSSTPPVGVDARVRFTWRNNAGVGKKKDTAFRVELNKAAAGWELAACRATEKVGF